MNFSIARALAQVALLAVAASACAQSASRPARPDPLDAQAAVPAATYKPALAAYRRLRDDPPVAWREANDTVHGIGGWRAYAREAQASPGPAAPSSAPAAAATAPASPASAGAVANPSSGRGAHRMP
ncbi:MAG: hypothetical protein Q8K96_07825 [Rubrivivax sp.]|nr:hypothetical protein [Rubrivivax sp.]